MSFDLSDLSITTIGYSEPTLWAAIVLSSIVAVSVGLVLGRTFGQVRDRWRRRLYGGLVSVVGALAFVVFTVLALETFWAHYHRGTVCTAFVTPVLLLPMLLGLAAERLAWTRTLAHRASDERSGT